MKKVVTILTGIIGILLVVAGVITKEKKVVSVSIIGGADGPTSVFLAGNVGSDISLGLIVAGIILIAILMIGWFGKQKK